VHASSPERWRIDALSQPSSDSKGWSAVACFDDLLTTAAMDKTAKSVWCRANGQSLHVPAARRWQTLLLTAPRERRHVEIRKCRDALYPQARQRGIRRLGSRESSDNGLDTYRVQPIPVHFARCKSKQRV